MFPPKQPPQGMPPAAVQPPQGAQAGAAPPPPSGGPPQPGAAQGGPQMVANIGFNQGVQNILLSRIQKMSPQDQKTLDAVLTPQTIPVFLKLLPELKPLFDAMMQQAQQGPIGQQPPGAGAPPAQAGQGAPAPAAGGGAPSAAQPGGQPGQDPDDEEDEESDNPLVSGPASQGLIG